MIAWLKPPADKKQVNLGTWPLRLLTYMDPDSFGRLLGEVYWTDDAGVEHHANGELLQMGLAVPYSP
jgi:endonuclease YncB( thermonuclease family)